MSHAAAISVVAGAWAGGITNGLLVRRSAAAPAAGEACACRHSCSPPFRNDDGYFEHWNMRVQFPLDTVKTKLQLRGSTYKGPIDVVRKARAVTSIATPLRAAAAPSGSLCCRPEFAQYSASYASRIICATAILNVAACSCSRERLLAWPAAGAAQVLAEQGPRGMLRGFQAGVLGSCLSSGLYFGTYELGKAGIARHNARARRCTAQQQSLPYVPPFLIPPLAAFLGAPHARPACRLGFRPELAPTLRQGGGAGGCGRQLGELPIVGAQGGCQAALAGWRRGQHAGCGRRLCARRWRGRPLPRVLLYAGPQRTRQRHQLYRV